MSEPRYPTSEPAQDLAIPTRAQRRRIKLAWWEAMVDCWEGLSDYQRSRLEAWEAEHIDGSSAYGTSDWPGWAKHIGPKPTWPREERRIPDRPRPPGWHVYRLRDSRGELLYVGVSGDVKARLSSHRAKDWGHRIAAVETEPHPTENAALIAELQAIASEHPIYNKAGRQ